MSNVPGSGKPPSVGSGARQKRSGEPPWEALLQAMADQTNAITRLAASNEALVESLMEGEAEDEGGIPRTL